MTINLGPGYFSNGSITYANDYATKKFRRNCGKCGKFHYARLYDTSKECGRCLYKILGKPFSPLPQEFTFDTSNMIFTLDTKL